MPHNIMQSRIRQVVSEITGHNPNDLDADLFLESDLGIDSIKMVELTQSLMLLIPDQQRETFMASVPSERLMQVQTLRELDAIFGATGSTSAAAPAAAMPAFSPPAPAPVSVAPGHAAHYTRATPATSLSDNVLGLISSITGHNPADLDPEMFLESDLGIDSIKMVELAQNLMQLVPDSERDAFLAAVPTEQLMQVPTLAELIRILAPWQGPDAEPGPARMLPSAPQNQVSNQTLPLEILYAQYTFLVGHWAVSTCSLASRVRLQGPFDLALARQTWNDMLARHPGLRSRFVIPFNASSFKQYRFEVLENLTAPELDVIDLRHLTPEAQDAAVAAEIQRCVNHEWELDAPWLHRFYVMQLGEQLFEVFFHNHHLISDGLSNQQAMREFLILYRANATRRPTDLPPATTIEEYQKIVTTINAWHSVEEDKGLAEFIRNQGKQSFFWNPDNVARASQRADVRNYRFHIDPATTQGLLDLTRSLRVPINTLLVAAYLRTIATFGNLPDTLFINIPTSGRVYPGVDASGIIGCFAQNLALGFASPIAGESWSELVLRVQQEVRNSISNGYDRAQTRQAALMVRDRLKLENGRMSEASAGIVRAGMKSNLYLPYIGNTHIELNYGPMQVLDYQAATVTNAGTLDTVVELFHGGLTCATNFDNNYYTVEFVALIADRYIEQLRDLAKYTVPANIAGKTSVAVRADSETIAKVRQVAEEIAHHALGSADLDKDLEADLGLDSLERIRIVSRLEHFVGKFDRQVLLACRTLNEIAAALMPATTLGQSILAAPDTIEINAIPYLQIVEQCRRTPDAIAVMSDNNMLSYGQLQRQSNQLAHLLRAQGVGRGTLVGIMLNRGSNMLVALLAVLKAGGAYVPLDPDYPAARLSYMLEHSKITTLLLEQALSTQLAACLSPTLALATLVYLDEPQSPGDESLSVLGRSAWNAQPAQDVNCISHPDDPMVVLYTSGSTGKPKGVVLGHRGYANRFEWHQTLFQLHPGERVAQKTSICFDISVWELFWPLMHGGTVCPVQTAVLRDPWQLAHWVRETRIDLMHFVPSLFGEFLNAIEQQPLEFPNLRQLVFSGEALPVAYVKRWMSRFGQKVGLTNLYGPTEASIDVSAHRVSLMPSPSDTRIPIGKAMPNVYLMVLDDAMQALPNGVVGELWIGGIQLAHGYLNDPERTGQSFKPNPFPNVPGKFLYKTGDLAVQMPDGSYDYRGRIDTQIKIRGYRVELGEIEAVLCSHPAILEAAVLALDYGDGHLRISAWLCGRHLEVRELREFMAQYVPHYMVPHRFDFLPSLPKNQNGKLDRNALKQLALSNGQLAASSEAAATVAAAAAPVAVVEYEVSPAQHWLLTYFSAPYQWAGFNRFTYLQPLDLGAFNQALTILAGREPALRSVFYQKNSRWFQQFPELKDQLQAEYYDGSHLQADERQVQLKQLINERVAGLRIDGGALLWAVIVVKESDSRFDICTIGHHIISDMLSNTQLFKSLWNIYREILSGTVPTVETKKSAFIRYLDEMEKNRQPNKVGAYVDYWNNQFPSNEPHFTLPMDRRSGSNNESSSATERFTLLPAEHAALQRARQRHNCGIYLLLLAPLYRLLAEWSGQPRVVLSHRTHGRELGDGNSFYDGIGDFAVNYPLAVRVNGGAAWANLLTDIRSAIENVPLNGVSYDLVGSHLPANLYPDNQLTQVRANYLGNRDIRPSSLFEFDRDEWDQRFSPPEQKRISLLEVFFSSSDGAMHIDLNYSSNFHTPATMRRLGQRYLDLVRDMLAQTGEVASAASLPRPVPQPLAPAPARMPAAQPAAAVAITPPDAAAASPAVTGRTLEGKVVIVTGAGRGIGRDIAKTLARQGARIALVSRSEQQLNEALAEVRQISADTIAIAADITEQAQVEAMVAEVVAKMGGIDVLINNAGINSSCLLAESDPKEWLNIVNVNLIGNYLCCRSAIPHLIARGGGKIINLGSAASVIGYPLFTAYSASKHGVLGLTKALAEELKQKNIQVNALCPAFVDTRMTPQAFRSNSIPTAHIADVVLFLASPASVGITGESINIFGKQDMYSYGSEKLNLIQTMTKGFKPGVNT